MVILFSDNYIHKNLCFLKFLSIKYMLIIAFPVIFCVFDLTNVLTCILYKNSGKPSANNWFYFQHHLSIAYIVFQKDIPNDLQENLLNDSNVKLFLL